MTLDRSSLKALVLSGTTWTVVGHGGGQLIRLARSLILTRLLYPEAFGLMSLVAAIMYGLEMLSDTGVGPAITRDKRGEDPDFLNTGWTIQVIRGVLLWLISCLIALPVAHFYGLPELAQLIPAVGLTTVLGGFSSTAFHRGARAAGHGGLDPDSSNRLGFGRRVAGQPAVRYACQSCISARHSQPISLGTHIR